MSHFNQRGWRSWRRVALAALLAWPLPGLGERLVELGAVRLEVKAKSWKDFRDQGVVKQEHDFSCGAASLATVLKHYYRMNVDEAKVLEALAIGDYAASFHDLAEAAEKVYGLRTLGLSADFAALHQLKLPVIVFLDVGKLGHFAVLRGIDDAGRVWLADPSHGNQLYAKHQFLRIWNLEDEGQQRGRLLAILPAEAGKSGADSDFFVAGGLARAMRP